MRMLQVMSMLQLRPCSYSGTNFTTAVNCRNLKNEIQRYNIKKQSLNNDSSL